MALAKKKTRFPGFRMIKAKTDTGGNPAGAASSWRMSEKEDDCSLFLEIAPQTGSPDDMPRFDWRKFDQGKKEWNETNSIVVNLGIPDIGEILLVLNGVKDDAGGTSKDPKFGLYHNNENGSSTIQFSTWKKDETLLGYGLRVFNNPKEGQKKSVSHTISLAEGEVLRVLLQNSILRICNW